MRQLQEDILMAVASSVENQTAVEESGRPWRFTVDDYYRMAEVGILPPDARVEMIEGEVIAMNPIGNRHATCVRRLNALLHERLGNRSIIDNQNPLPIGKYSEPEPDVLLLSPRPDFYA